MALKLLENMANNYTRSVGCYFYQNFSFEENYLQTPSENIYDDPLRNAMVLNFNQKAPLARFISAFLKAYSNVALIDLQTKRNKPAPMYSKISDIRNCVIRVLSKDMDKETKVKMIRDEKMTKPLLYIWSSPYPELLDRAILFMDIFCHFVKFDSFDNILLELIQEYLVLFATHLDNLVLIPGLARIIKEYVRTLDSSEKTNKQLCAFWDHCWKLIGTVVESSAVWAIKCTPEDLVNSVIPVLELGKELINNQNLFKKQDRVFYIEVYTTMESLSQWIYITHKDVICLVNPLVIGLLDLLRSQSMKISQEAYDRLMAASMGVNESILNEEEKKVLSDALTEHAPVEEDICNHRASMRVDFLAAKYS